MAPPNAPPVGHKVDFTAFALQQQANLLSPGLGMVSADDEAGSASDSPGKRKAVYSAQNDEKMHPLKRPSLERFIKPGESIPQQSSLSQPAVEWYDHLGTPDTPSDIEMTEDDLPGSLDGSADSKLARKKLSNAAKRQKQKLKKATRMATVAAAASAPTTTTTPTTTPSIKPPTNSMSAQLAPSPGASSSELLSLEDFLGSFPGASSKPAVKTGEKKPTPPTVPKPAAAKPAASTPAASTPAASSPKPATKVTPTLVLKKPQKLQKSPPKSVTFAPGPPPCKSTAPSSGPRLNLFSGSQRPRELTPTPAQSPYAYSMPRALQMLSLPYSTTKRFECAKCRVLRPIRLLSRDPAWLTPSLVEEGYAPLCIYCADRSDTANDGAAQVRWCERGGHESFREWHWGMSAEGERVEVVDCLREKHADEKDVGPLIKGEQKGEWEGWRAGKSSSGLWVVEGDGGRAVREKRDEEEERKKEALRNEEREERIKEKKKEKKRRQRENKKKAEE